MIRFRNAAFAVHPLGGLAVALCIGAGQAAELPSSAPNKARPPEAVKKCNIGGMPGVLTADGVCVRLSGSISAAAGGGKVK